MAQLNSILIATCFILVSLQWTKLDIQGPPPPCRLDFGMCVVELRRRLHTESTSEVVSATKQAQEVLEKEMAKPGSASSRSSCPDFAVTGTVKIEKVWHPKKIA